MGVALISALMLGWQGHMELLGSLPVGAPPVRTPQLLMIMTMATDNRRQFHRIDFDGMADLSFVTKSYGHCQIKNLSLTGMCVLGHFRKHRQQDCQVKLFHKEKSGNNCVRAIGTVVWSSGEGIGLRFARMSFENYMLLQTTLIQNADQPEIILRELPSEIPFEITGF